MSRARYLPFLVRSFWVTTLLLGLTYLNALADPPVGGDAGIVRGARKDFLFVLDISGSMTPPEGMLHQVQLTAADIVAKLDKKKNPYSLGLITFNGCGPGTANVLIRVGKEYNGGEFMAAMNSIVCGGATDITGALTLANKEMDAYAGGGCLQVVLLTDGEHSCGGAGPERLMATLPKHKSACKNGFSVVHVGQDKMYADQLDKITADNEGKTFFLNPETKAQDLRSALGEIFSVESEAVQTELKAASGGGNATGPKKTPEAAGGKKPDAPPAEKDKEEEAEAEAKEKKERKQGGPTTSLPTTASRTLAAQPQVSPPGQTPASIWPEPNSRILDPSGQYKIELYEPGKSKMFFLTGNLVWSSATESRSFGSCPAQAYPNADGVYVVLQREGLISLEFWGKDGQQTVLNDKLKLDWNDYARKYQFVLDINGIQMVNRQENLSQTFTRPRAAGPNGKPAAAAEIVAVRAPFDETASASIEKFGRSLVTGVRQGRVGPGPLLPVRYEEFRKRVNFEKPRNIMIRAGEAMDASDLVIRLAQELAKAPEDSAAAWDIFEIDIASLGTQGKADLSKEKMSNIIAAARYKRVILFFRNLERMIGMGGNGGDLIDDLLTAAQSGQVIVIASTSGNNEQTSELNQKQALRITLHDHAFPDYDMKRELPQFIRMRADAFAAERGVGLAAGLESKLIEIAGTQLPETPHPASDMVILEEAVTALAEKMSLQGVAGSAQVELPDLLAATKKMTIPVPYVDEEKVMALRAALDAKIIGQRGMKDRVVDCFRRRVYQGGIVPNKPVCLFLALGGSGTGKTFTGKTLSGYFGVKMESWQMEQFKEEHKVDGLLGPPHGYVGYGSAPLIDFMNQNKTGLVLFDEVDKANREIITAFDVLFDEGWIKSTSGAKAVFNRGVIFMTSNFGIGKIKAWEEANPDWRNYNKQQLMVSQNALIKEIQGEMRAKNAMPDWTIGRIPLENWLVYTNLNQEEGLALAKLMAKDALAKRPKATYKIEFSEPVYEKLVRDNYGRDSTGARPLETGLDYLLNTLFYDLLGAMLEHKDPATGKPTLTLNDLAGKTLRVVVEGQGTKDEGYAIEIH
ncbi:MAG: AAA family ATPase [Bacteriovoracia bacterium]